MANRNGYYRQNSGLWRALRDGDFEEADVWAVFKDREETKTHTNYSKVRQSLDIESPLSVQRSLNFPSAARMIPRTSSSSSSSSNNFTSDSKSKGGKQQQQSAPVTIPDWSKISHKKSKEENHDAEDDSDSDDDTHGYVNDGSGDSYDDDDNEDVYDYKVPPHEFIAKRLAKSQISSFSVFEGVGRTLKGRDLSKVRNAILTKTGFLE